MNRIIRLIQSHHGVIINYSKLVKSNWTNQLTNTCLVTKMSVFLKSEAPWLEPNFAHESSAMDKVKIQSSMFLFRHGGVSGLQSLSDVESTHEFFSFPCFLLEYDV